VALKHSTQPCVVVSQRRAKVPVQSVLARHWTQVSLVVSQTGRGKAPTAPPSTTQSGLLRHCTQRIMVVSQYGLGAAQVALEVHEATQRSVFRLHVWFAAQLPLARHCTHVSVDEQ
jgi:hypothetical protein